MRYPVIEEGLIGAGSLTACSRLAVIGPSELVCTYMVRSGAGVSDFVPRQARSLDGGSTWSEEGRIWPDLDGPQSISCALSRAPNGDLFLYGTTTLVEQPGEIWWDDERAAMKQNDLFWARSRDAGRTWTPPNLIPMPIPGGAEAPGPLTVLRDGRWVACYAPYNTFDRDLVVDRDQVVVVLSDDEGGSWHHTSMLRFADPDGGGAEAWVVELADGRLIGTCWNMSLATGHDELIPYAISHDRGETWTTTRSSGIVGQATSLAPLPDGRVLVAYNQRVEPDPGVWLAILEPTDTDAGVVRTGPAWLAQQSTHSDGSTGHDAWTDFAFGEPSVTVLPSGDVLITLWCDQPSGKGVQFVKLEGTLPGGGLGLPEPVRQENR